MAVNLESVSSLPVEFFTLLENCTPIQKKEMLIVIRNSLSSDSKSNSSENIDFTQYVEHSSNFVPDNFLEDALMAEVSDMGLLKKSGKPLTQWLSSDERPYYFSDKTHLKHDAKNIHDYPTVCQLMDLVNQDTRTTQNANSALVIVYNDNGDAINFHDDNEELIDSKSSISTVSFGSTRKVEFCSHSLRPRRCQYSVDCSNHDLMIMKPGCQNRLLHRVCKGNTPLTTDNIRVVISFRRLVTDSPERADPEVPVDDQSTDSNSSTVSAATPTPAKKVTIVAGDSFIVGLDVERLGRKGKKSVVNLAKGGATISDVENQLETYFMSADVGSAPDVEKVILCVGTNDIRNCKENGIRHLKQPLISLVELIKTLFPNSKIWFQSIVPLLIQNQFSVKNVKDYNSLLFEVCSYTKIYFLNVFGAFLQYNRNKKGWFRNEFYFVNFNNIHLNKIGLGMLARSYIRLIHSDQFNPLGF